MRIACCHIYTYVQPSCSQHYDKNADILQMKKHQTLSVPCCMQGWRVYTLEFLINKSPHCERIRGEEVLLNASAAFTPYALNTSLSPYSVAIFYMKLCHHTLSPYFTWITSPYSVAIFYMKLRHHTLSPYSTWNYFTVPCRHTVHKIRSQFSVPILYIKLRRNALSPYFTWNYPASRFEQLTLLLRILEVPRSYFDPVTGCLPSVSWFFSVS